ncbi:ATP-binding protein [Melittangium boletus]|uniref:histidine kinase n=1 Tax=Melittangium boletus DSM 14713 TaxID=1294270 RepID=A0A250IIP0_9BACT|nr:ATP-binding protein [Melittangium boletus]ATB31017.1 histidine kinase [Melittangium boletus DSM 14713]
MSIHSRSHASLSRATLLKMGVRIAGVIALTTLLSYLHVLSTVRTENLVRLERYVLERSQREEGIFLLAEDNHLVLQKALRERLEDSRHEDGSARFASLFVRLPDGTVRNRPESFDGTRMPGVFIPGGLVLDAELRQRILASYDVLTQYGPAFHTRFTNTYIVLPEGVLVLYWPERPSWCQDAETDHSVVSFDFFVRSLPAENASRRTVWCDIYSDPVTQNRMVSVSTPLDLDGDHVATFVHDVLLEELMARASHNHLPGAYNMILGDAGQPIVHPELVSATPHDTGDPAVDAPGTKAQWLHLRRMFERLRDAPQGQTVVELPEDGEYLAHARLEGPGWNFVTVLPESVVSRPALQSARYVLLFGVGSLLLELAIMYWVLRQQITRPLLAFTQATGRVAAGEFRVELDTSRGDELGQLASAFRLMADQVQRREEELRQSNELLEQRVAERTRELKDIHRRLVESARQEGMAEIATNVLHNVGNVLNSVRSSAQLAKERMAQTRFEQVGRVALLLREHQDDLAAFLARDERGQFLIPFMEKLGQNLMEERQHIRSLLDDVDRYTEHIDDIVRVQQNYARMPRLHEPVLLKELVEDALRIDSAGLGRHRVKVEKHLAELPPVLTDKHKLLMILVNLISNARHALDTVPADERRVTVRLGTPSADRFRLEVGDNGVGIAPELHARLFQYGFTTREKGHGFGLHSSALAAQELGGSLTVHSDGPGHGATFILELPYQPAQEPQRMD